MFCQKYRFHKILHATGKSRKQFSRPLGHRPDYWERRKNESLQTDKDTEPNIRSLVRRERPVRHWDCISQILANTCQIQRTGGAPLSADVTWTLTSKATEEEHKECRKQQSSYLTMISSLKVTEITRCSQTLERSLLPLGERQWNAFQMLRWLDTSHLTTAHTVKPRHCGSFL